MTVMTVKKVERLVGCDVCSPRRFQMDWNEEKKHTQMYNAAYMYIEIQC